jgi:hypothetical protein
MHPLQNNDMGAHGKRRKNIGLGYQLKVLNYKILKKKGEIRLSYIMLRNIFYDYIISL